MLIYYFLPIIISLAIITSYEDIKIGKIRNKWILTALIFSFFINLFLFLTNNITGKEIIDLSINFGITIIFAFVLWNFKFWSAGDGKLFIAYASLIPVIFYSAPFINIFPSFNLFINTIIPFFIYLLIKKIYVVPKNKIKKLF